MNFKNIFGFLKKDNEEERICKKCGQVIKYSLLFENDMICPSCNTYMRMGALERIAKIPMMEPFQKVTASWSAKT